MPLNPSSVLPDGAGQGPVDGVPVAVKDVVF